MARGFHEMGERFGGLEHRLDSMEKTMATKSDISHLEMRIEAIADMIDTVKEGQILPLQRRVAVLEKGYRMLTKHVLHR